MEFILSGIAHYFAEILGYISEQVGVQTAVAHSWIYLKSDLHEEESQMKEELSGGSGKIETGIKTQRGRDEWDTHVERGRL